MYIEMREELLRQKYLLDMKVATIDEDVRKEIIEKYVGKYFRTILYNKRNGAGNRIRISNGLWHNQTKWWKYLGG